MKNFFKTITVITSAIFMTVMSSCKEDGPVVEQEKSVTVASQSGDIVAGEEGRATFAIMAANIADGSTITIAWQDASGGTTDRPAGITPAASALTGGKATVTMAATAEAATGAYSFKVTIDGTTSDVATLTVQEKPLYRVTVEPVEGGKATAAVEGGAPAASVEAYKGTEITLAATVEVGYVFSKWIVVEGNVIFEANEANPTTFSMPAGDVTVKAEIVPESTYDAGVLIMGLVWATRNVDAPGTFAATPTDTGMFYQWNRLTGWSYTDPITAYDSDGEIAVAEWSATNEEGTAWLADSDPCPEGWRMPIMTEIGRLMDDRSVTGEWVPAADGTISGKKFTEDNSGESIFLPAAGRRSMDAGELSLSGFEGFYWSASESNTMDHTGAWFLDITPSKTLMQGDPKRGLGQSVRCVSIE